jgi:tetratricopeptide (TPR) repeat protein
MAFPRSRFSRMKRMNLLSSVVLALLFFSLPVFSQDEDDLLIDLPRFPQKGIPSTHERVNEGARLLSAGQSLKAEAILGQALVENPQSAEAAYNFGLALAFNGKHSEAVQAYFKALELRTDFPEAHLALGATYLSAGQNESALLAFNQALQTDSASEIRQAALFNKGVALGRLKRFPEAEMCLAETLALSPDDPSAAFQLGRLQMQQGKWQEGADWLESTIHDLPLESHTLRAKAFIRLKQKDKASESLKLAQDALAQADLADSVRIEVQNRLEKFTKELTQSSSATH